MSKRLNISSGAKWEDIVGYSRAVRVGNTVEVAGTTAVDERGEVVGLNNPYEQTKYILAKIEKALIEDDPALPQKRIEVANTNTWQARIEQLWTLVDKFKKG